MLVASVLWYKRGTTKALYAQQALPKFDSVQLVPTSLIIIKTICFEEVSGWGIDEEEHAQVWACPTVEAFSVDMNM